MSPREPTLGAVRSGSAYRHAMTTDPTEMIYAATCPNWCQGQHEPLLAMPDQDEAPCAEEIAFHTLELGASQDGKLTVELIQAEPHPASTYPAAGARVMVWCADGLDGISGTPGEVRRWAAILGDAADRAERTLSR